MSFHLPLYNDLPQLWATLHMQLVELLVQCSMGSMFTEDTSRGKTGDPQGIKENEKEILT